MKYFSEVTEFIEKCTDNEGAVIEIFSDGSGFISIDESVVADFDGDDLKGGIAELIYKYQNSVHIYILSIVISVNGYSKLVDVSDNILISAPSLRELKNDITHQIEIH